MKRRLPRAWPPAAALLAVVVPAFAPAGPPDHAQTQTAGPLVGPLVLGVYPLMPVSPAPAPPPKAPAFTCPYLRDHAQAAARPAAGPTELPCGEVLANLKALEDAEGLCELAEALLREGHAWEAVQCCAEACQMAPGSRIEEDAGRLLVQAAWLCCPAEAAGADGTAGGAEESEPLADVLSRLASAHGSLEVGLDCAGTDIRLAGDLHCAGRVYHFVVAHGVLAGWSTADDSGLKTERDKSPR
jgi:hypothetical protein